MDLYEIIVNTVDDPISYLDRDYIYRAVNETYAKDAKRPREEIVGMSAAELLGTEFFEEQVRPHLDRCLAGEQFQYQSWFPVPGESPRLMDVGYYPVREQDGSVAGVVVASRDLIEGEQAEEAWRESERKFGALFQGMPVPVYTWQQSGDDFVLVDYNNAADEITGGKIGNFVGKTVTGMYPDRPDIVEHISRCFAEKVSIQREMEYRFKSTGERKTLVVKYAFVPPDLVLVQTEDITERVRAQEEAAYERDLMRTLLENTPDYIYFKDRDRRFVRVSNSFRDLFKRDIDDIIGKRDEDLFPLEIAAGKVCDDRDVIETGTALIDREEGGESIGGEEPWVSTTKLPWYDQDGDIIGLFGMSREITKRKRAEEALRVSQERYETATQAAGVGVWDWNIQTGEFYLDPNVKAILGYTDEEIPNDIEVWTTYVHPEDRQPVMEAAQAHLEGRTPEYTFEHRMLHKDGSVHWIMVRGVAVRNAQGQAIRLVGSDTDITERKEAEEALRASRQFAQSSLDALSAHIAILDSSGTILAVNASWRRFADQNGLKWDDYGVGRNYLQVTETASGELSRLAHEAAAGIRGIVAGQREVFVLEYPCHSPEQERWFVLRVTRFEGREGVRVVTSHEDITARMQAERTLRQERDLVSRIMDTSPVGITVFDRQGRITFANALVEQKAALLGESNLVGLTYKDPAWQIMTVDGRPIGDEEYPFVRVMNTGHSLYDAHYAIEPQEGQRRFISVNASPLLDESGQRTGVVTTTEDITAHMRSQERLRESEETYRNLVEKISDVIYAIDTSGVTTYVSPAIESFLGFTAEQVIGQPFARFIVPEDLGRSEDRFQELMSGVSPGPAEYRLLTSSGETRWIRVSSQPIVEGGRVTGVQGVLTDITERKRVEEQLEEAAASAERQRLARELHDAVTQTLFAASLMTETLPTVWDREPQAAREGLEKLRDWIRGALAELRIMLLELRPDELPGKPLDDLIRQLADGLMARTRTPVTTTVVGDCLLPTEVKLALYRIAQEALNNVAKHAQASQIQVFLSCEPGHVTLEISDDGWGFDPNDIESGQLGLGIMYERAKGIGGDLNVESHLDKGTAVTVIWKDVVGDEHPATGPGKDWRYDEGDEINE